MKQSAIACHKLKMIVRHYYLTCNCFVAFLGLTSQTAVDYHIRLFSTSGNRK